MSLAKGGFDNNKEREERKEEGERGRKKKRGGGGRRKRNMLLFYYYYHYYYFKKRINGKTNNTCGINPKGEYAYKKKQSGLHWESEELELIIVTRITKKNSVRSRHNKRTNELWISIKLLRLLEVMNEGKTWEHIGMNLLSMLMEDQTAIAKTHPTKQQYKYATSMSIKERCEKYATSWCGLSGRRTCSTCRWTAYKLAKHLVRLGYEYQLDVEIQKAIEYIEQGLAIQTSLFGLNHSKNANVCLDLAHAYCDDAEHMKAIDIYGHDDPRVQELYKNVAFLYESIDRLDKAIEYHIKKLHSQLRYISRQSCTEAN
ncbi:hypothetical protein RFI_12141, partial [Reticulomyxa filosa]